MIKLTVVSDYRSSYGTFVAGQELELDDHVANLLLRDSPGSFEVASAISAATATGLVVPDRRARGGGVR